MRRSRRVMVVTAALAVAVGIGVAGARAVQQEQPAGDGDDASRRAEIENLLRLSGEPFTDADVDVILEEEALYPQEVQDVEHADPSTDVIVNRWESEG